MRGTLIKMSKVSKFLTENGMEPPLDEFPHGLEGRLRRPAYPAKVKVKKTEGPRAYAPRI